MDGKILPSYSLPYEMAYLGIELFFVMPDTIVFNLGSAGIRKVKVSWKPTSAVINCSSRQMKVDPVKLGTLNPLP